MIRVKPMRTQLMEHLEKIKYFQVIGESRSIQQAAKKIGIAQPALSKSLKILENAVGSLLVERSRQGIFLTHEGRLLLQFSYEIQDLVKNIEVNFRKASKGLSGSLNIGTHELYVPHLWPKILKKSANFFPELNLKLYTDVRSSNLLHLLTTRKLDLVIAIDSPNPSNINKCLLYEDTYSFYGAKEIKVTDELIKKTFFLPNSVIDRHQNLQGLLDSNNYRLKPTYEVSSYASVLSLVLSGVGLGVLPSRPAKFYQNNHAIRKISKLKLVQKPHKVCVYTRSSTSKNSEINLFNKQVLNVS